MIRFEYQGKKYGLSFAHPKMVCHGKGWSGERRYTKAFIFDGWTKDDPILIAGTATCHEGENFSRGVGRIMALDQALHSKYVPAHKGFRKTVWESYRKVCKDNKQTWDTVNKLRKAHK